MSIKQPERELYPEIEPYATEHLKVSEIHNIYIEQCGNRSGKPLLYVHGGPGRGTYPEDRRFFDPEVYRIILFHQRGSGKSTPVAELKENTTWDVVADMEKIRTHFNIDKWVVFGGSWGSALSLAYAETHPDRVKALVLRGIYTMRRCERSWLFQDGASVIFPDKWEDFIKPIPESERGDMLSAYHKQLNGDNVENRLHAATAWCNWGSALTKLLRNEELLNRTMDGGWAIDVARLDCHYAVHGGFFETDGQLLAEVDKIRHIPCTIVQGRYDVVCPPETAWLLRKKWPEAEFHMVPDAGHSRREPGITSRLMDATDKYKSL